MHLLPSKRLAKHCPLHQGRSVVLCLPDFHRLITYNLRISVSGVDTILNGSLIHIAIIDAVYASLLPFRMHTVKQEINGVKLMQSTENMEPSEREKPSIGLLVSLCKVGNTDTKTHQIIALVHDKLHKTQVYEREILLNINVDLLLSNGDKIVEVLE